MEEEQFLTAKEEIPRKAIEAIKAEWKKTPKKKGRFNQFGPFYSFIKSPELQKQTLSFLRSGAPPIKEIATKAIKKFDELRKNKIRGPIVKAVGDKNLRFMLCQYFLIWWENPSRQEGQDRKQGTEACCPRPDFDKEIKSKRKILDSLRKKKLLTENQIKNHISSANDLINHPRTLAWRIADTSRMKRVGRPEKPELDYLIAALVLSFKRGHQVTLEMLQPIPAELIRLAEEGKKRINWIPILKLVDGIDPDIVNWETLKERYYRFKNKFSCQS